MLSVEERVRASRFAFDRDRKRFVGARSYLRRLLGARLGIRPEAVELEIGPYGKPVLAPRLADSGLRFNISHADDTGVYGFAWGREVGIDVERVRRIPDADAIVTHMFARREAAAYMALDEQDKPTAFFNAWTRKEAFVKAIGEGLSYPLGSFDVSLTPGERARLLRVGDMPGDECGWTLWSFVPASDFVGAVVAQAEPSAVQRSEPMGVV